MTTLDLRLDEATSNEKKKVLGTVCLGKDRDGHTLLSRASGKVSLSPEAPSITAGSVITLASCTKLVTTLTALRLVQASLLSLDDPSPIEKHLPELCAQDVIISAPGQPLTFTKRTRKITLRTLLTHSSGSGFDILSAQLQVWRKSRGEECIALNAQLPEAVSTPGLFEPGEGWAYGGGLDWVGLLISRVTGLSLGEAMRKEVFDLVGCDRRAGFKRQDFEEEIVQVVTRGPDGELVPFNYPPTEMKSERGSGGLYMSSENFMRILADLISPNPQILAPEMLDILFTAQFSHGSKALESLRQAAPVFKGMTGALTGDLPPTAINHALGGVLITEDNPRLGTTKGTMTWGGACNCLWFVNRDVGVAGWYGSSMFPPGDETSGKLMAGFAEELWRKRQEAKE